MVNQIYPPDLKLNKDNTSDTEAPFLDFYIYPFLMVLFPPKLMIKAMTEFDIVMFPFRRCPTSLLLWSVYFSTYKIC